MHPLALIYLTLSIALMVAVPFLSKQFQSYLTVRKQLQKIVGWIVSVTVILHILPEAYGFAGILAPIIASLGFLSSLIFDSSKLTRFIVHSWFLPLVVLGLGLHGILDGMVINLVGTDTYISGTAPIIVLHRIPAGLYIWTLLEEEVGIKKAWMIYGILCAAFFAGFASGNSFKPFIMDSRYFVGSLQALLVGGVLHHAFHQGVQHEDEHG
jgi:hypothetical protein